MVYLKDEQDYLEWTKEIKKMKYNKEVKDYLLLPLGERFISETDLLCVMTPRLEVFFEQYREDLETVIERYKELKMDLS